MHVSLTANPGAIAAIPAVLAFAACPAMCAAMGGAMWLRKRFSKGKNQTQAQEPVVTSKREIVEAKTESMESKQQITYPQKQRKDKTAAQDTSATSD